MDDLISREAVREVYRKCVTMADDISALTPMINGIEDLPSVQPSQEADIIKFEGTNMACMGGDEIMKEFEEHAKAESCEKTISLERAKKQIGRWIGYIDQDMINRICMSLDALPSVQPSRKGHWEKITDCGKVLS